MSYIRCPLIHSLWSHRNYLFQFNWVNARKGVSVSSLKLTFPLSFTLLLLLFSNQMHFLPYSLQPSTASNARQHVASQWAHRTVLCQSHVTTSAVSAREKSQIFPATSTAASESPAATEWEQKQLSTIRVLRGFRLWWECGHWERGRRRNDRNGRRWWAFEWKFSSEWHFHG